MRGDVLPPKRQAVVDRLRRRIELYRRHHNVVLPRQGQANSAVSDDQRQETLLLKQRYLESKAKKAKKSEHKTLKDTSGAAATSSADSHKNLLQKANKRTAGSMEATLESTTDAGQLDEKDHRLSKIPRTSSSSDKQGLQQQQMSLDSQQMQNIPGFECIKQSSTGPAIAPKSPGAAGAAHNPSLVLCNVKKERDTFGYCGQANDCACSQETTTSSAAPQSENTDVGEKFLDVFPNLGLPEDSSEIWVDNPEILRHLIDDITNPSDLMTDFNFNYSMEGIKDTESLETHKNEGASTASINDKKSRQQQTGFAGSESFVVTSQASQQMLVSAFEQRSASAMDNLAANTACLPQQSFSPSNPRSSQFSASNMSSLDFKLSEPSPAAQTLKQMAEQHQQHKQGHDKHSMVLGVPRPSFSPGDNFDVSLAASRSAIFSTSENSLNTSKVMQTSAMFPNVSFGSQALTTTIQSNFRPDGAVRSGNTLPGVVFGKANGAQNPYVVQNNPVDATRRQTVSQITLRLQEQQKCAPKGTQYSNNSTDEKTAFVNNFKASLAQFNEVNSAPSPPLVKSPSQFSKQMSSPMNSQASIMMGPSNHGTIQANALQQQGVKDTKDISPLNISSNPSYAEALAFSSGNTRGMNRGSIGPLTHFQTQQQPQQQQAQMQQHRDKPGFTSVQFMEANQLSQPPSSSPADIQSHQLQYSQSKNSVAPSRHLQQYAARVQNSMALQGLPPQGPPRATRPTVQAASGQLRARSPQFVHRVAALQPANLNSVQFQNPGSMSFNASRMPLPIRAASPQQVSGAMRHPISAPPVSAVQKPLYTNAVMRPQHPADFAAPQRDWQCAMGQGQALQQQQQQVCFQPQTSQSQSRVGFGTLSQGSAPRPPPFQPPQLSIQQQQAMTSTLPPLPQLQIPPRSTAPQTSTFSPSFTSSISDFNLEFLESIENSDSDLLNFDPVNSNFGILDDVLGGK
uniref:Putative mediator of rna polymerase ii transcription subunit 15 n=1 Tax=Amblyomma aureolatum TaxID=187763 RepID=A0A1E1X9U5_9ACAR